MAFEERIRVVIDVVTDRAKRGLQGFRTDVAQAEGSIGKLKAGAANLGTQFSQYLGPAALAAGAALVQFGAKSVRAFEETALAAGKFHDATGIAVEDASRWIEVAGDVGINADQMESSFAKLNKALGQGDLKEWGIDADNATDGFLQTVEALRQIEDPTQRALLAQQAFGKGYTQIAELTAMSAGELRKALDGVSDAKAIDEDEVRKAKRLRDAVNLLADAYEDLQLVVGGVVADTLVEASETLETLDEGIRDLSGGSLELGGVLGGVLEAFNPLKNALEGINDTLEDGASIWQRLGGAIDTTYSWFPGVNIAVDKLTDSIFGQSDAIEGKLNPAFAEMGEKGPAALAAIEGETEDLLTPLSDLQQSLEDAADEMERLIEAVPQQFDAEEAFLNLEVAADGYFARLVEGKMTTEEARLAQIGLAKEALGAAEAWGIAGGAADGSAEDLGRTKDMLIQLQGQYPGIAGEIQVYIDALNRIPKNVNTQITWSLPSGGRQSGDVSIRTGVGATGGIVTQPTRAIIGEAGPEAVVPLSQMPGASPLPAGSAGVAAAPITVNVYGSATQADAEKVVEALKAWQRSNGPLPLSVST